VFNKAIGSPTGAYSNIASSALIFGNSRNIWAGAVRAISFSPVTMGTPLTSLELLESLEKDFWIVQVMLDTKLERLI
jgi:hypothetical protein